MGSGSIDLSAAILEQIERSAVIIGDEALIEENL